MAKSLAVLAGGVAAAGALPAAALLVGASSAGLGFYADYKTADYVRSCTTANAGGALRRAAAPSRRPPPMTFSAALTVLADLLSSI